MYVIVNNLQGVKTVYDLPQNCNLLGLKKEICTREAFPNTDEFNASFDLVTVSGKWIQSTNRTLEEIIDTPC